MHADVLYVNESDGHFRSAAADFGMADVRGTNLIIDAAYPLLMVCVIVRDDDLILRLKKFHQVDEIRNK